MRAVVHHGPLRAVIWDFDGTLVDTREKNMNVNRQIVRVVTDQPWERFPVLESVAAYDEAQMRFTNWRDFYHRGIGLSEDEVDRAGAMWTGLQLTDTTPAPLFDGIAAALGRLRGAAVQGIVSQNSRQNIEEMLEAVGLLHHFEHIVGYEEVGTQRQKPAPDGLLMCIEQLTNSAAGTVLYVGDHETDVRCGRNADRALTEQRIPLHVVTVGAFFDSLGSDGSWSVRPDFRASSPADVVTIVEELRGTDQGSP
jgi:phosphoglycolate phosphatase-like HAD superfamily hydrolase